MSSPKINVTPLIDVLLVLLIIFMVVAPLKPSSFHAKVPSEPNNMNDVSPNPNTLVVSIDTSLSISVNREKGLGNPDDTARLTSFLRDVFARRAENGVIDEQGNVVRTVFVKAPRKIGYGNVVKVIDALKMAGAEPIALQVDYLD